MRNWTSISSNGINVEGNLFSRTLALQQLLFYTELTLTHYIAAVLGSVLVFGNVVDKDL